MSTLKKVKRVRRTVCRICNKTKNRILYMDSSRHEDEVGRFWGGTACPDCFPEYQKEVNAENYKKRKLLLGKKDVYNWECDHCEKGFTTGYSPNKNQYPTIRYCSSGCRNTADRLRREGLSKGEGKCGKCKSVYKKEDPNTIWCGPCRQVKIDLTEKRKVDIKEREVVRLNKKEQKENELLKKRHTKLLERREKRLIKLKLKQRTCTTCNTIIKNTGIKYCSKKCKPRSPAQNASRKARKRMKRERKLSCVTWKQVDDYYKLRPEGFHVDHIIPINHPDVSGLHVPWNFQYLQSDDNMVKSNKFDGTYENEGWRTD